MKHPKKIRMMAGYVARTAKGFLRDKRGVAGLEFALIAPVLILLYLGIMEVTGGVDVNKNLSRASSAVADLVTQQSIISQVEIGQIMNIAQAILLPYRRDTPKITVTAINISNAGVATVAWSRRRVNGTDTTPFSAGSAVTLDPNLIIPGTSVIRVQMDIAYVPLIAWTITGTVNKANGASVVGLGMSRTAFGRVRQGAAVTCSNCS